MALPVRFLGELLNIIIKGSFAKRFHPGNAEPNGILAALMVQGGSLDLGQYLKGIQGS